MADISKINPNGTEYDIKDAVARGMVEGSKTATGNPITLTDASESYAEELEVELEPIQSGSGTPSPSNIRPITGYTDVNVGSVGKNLFDISALIIGGIDNSGKDYPDNSWRRTDYLFLTAGSYSIRRKTSSNWWKVYKYHEADQNTGIGFVFNNNTSTSESFTLTESCYIRVQFNYVPTSADEIQLERNAQPTTYEPYTSSTTHTPLGRTVYGGKLNVRTGELTFTHGFVDLYSFTWSWSSTYNGYYSDSKASGIKETSSTSVVPNILSNQFATYSMSQIVDGGISLLTSGATKGRFFIKTQQYESASAFRESLNGAYVVYELATPQTYQLTPQELKLLKQYNYITTNGTTISLKYQPDNVIGEAIGVSEEYTDRKVNGKIYTKTVTGTVWVNAQSARMLILYNESEAWDRIPIAAFYSTYKCTPYYVYENDTYTWSILIHKSDGTNATDISSGASITLQVVYMEA